MANNVLIYCVVNCKFECNFKFYNNKLSEKIDFIYLSFMYIMCFVLH